jgi:hypothetical protein
MSSTGDFQCSQIFWIWLAPRGGEKIYIYGDRFYRMVLVLLEYF